jgi:hypothetical protein
MLENILLFLEKNDKAIGLLHAFFAIFVSFYAIIFKQNWFDFIYIFYTIIVLISWTFYNGECLLTYLIKKNKNKNYIAGTESTDLTDMYLLFGSKEIIYFIVTFLLFINALSLYLVLKRNNFPYFIYYLIPLFQLLYTISLRIQYKNLHKNNLFLISQNFFKFYFIINLIYILYISYKK